MAEAVKWIVLSLLFAGLIIATLSFLFPSDDDEDKPDGML